MVHHLFQTAMFKEHMLPSTKFIGRITKLLRYVKQGRSESSIFNAGVAVPGYAQLQIERPISS